MPAAAARSASFLARRIEGMLAMPSNVVWATLASWAATAASISGTQWPCTLHQRELVASMYLRPSVSKRNSRSPRSMTRKSFCSIHGFIGVKGCQTWARSRAMRSAVVGEDGAAEGLIRVGSIFNT